MCCICTPGLTRSLGDLYNNIWETLTWPKSWKQGPIVNVFKRKVYIYWIPKMHKNPFKHRFIAGSSKCSTKPLSILLTKLFTHMKQGLQKYCETSYSRSGVNQMWIQKNSKELLEHLQSPNFNHITSIKSFDFSTLYTTIPHQKHKSRLATIIRNSFIHKNGNRRYKFLVLGREGLILSWNPQMRKTSTLKMTSLTC